MEKDIVTFYIDYVIEHAKEALIALAIGAGLAGAFFYYKNYTIELEQSAYSDFALALNEYQQALKEDSWQNVELASRAGSQQHASTKVGSFFQILNAESLHQEGKTEDAIALLASVLQKFSTRNSFYYIFAMKEALMRLSLDAEKQKGFEQLKQLADDTANLQRDQALYYLGLYYMNTSNRDEAYKVWQELTDQFANKKIGSSPWAVLAEQKVKQG